jgi:pilus assembly protein CpaC
MHSYPGPKRSKDRKMLPRVLTAAIFSLALFGAVMGPSVPPSQATDLDAGAVESGDQFVRIGLNKSVVIRLPAEARDVVVGNADVVDAVVRGRKVAYLFGKKPGQSNVFFFDGDGQQILALDLEVALDTLALKKLLKRALPRNRITVDTVNSSVVLGGTASPADAKVAMDLAKQFATGAGSGDNIVNTIRLDGEDQVMLKVKVVEVQRDVLKQLGVDFQALFNVGQVALNLASLNPFNSALLSPDGGYAGTDTSGAFQFDSVIRAMEGDGLLRLLAEPNLSAVSGHPAKFHAGGEFPYQVCDVSSSGRDCTIEFKEFGVNLDFTPTVMSEGRINLKIRTEVSELSTIASGSQSVPSINNREAETMLEMPSGGAMMIAGLIKESTRQNINGTPGLKKLPILGNLFRSREFVANETELVVIVTPYIIKPTSANALVGPDKNFNPATERQAFFFGRLNKTYGASGKVPSGSYHGNVGYIVE